MLSSSVKPHFFKPILRGFNSHLSIPEAFYSNYLEGNVVELTSDVSEMTWKIKIDGLRMAKDGKYFAVAHNLKGWRGDILVFRHEGNLWFHVTPLGLSCCEIVYSHDEDKINFKDKTRKLIRNRLVSSSSDDTNFVVPVTASNQRADSFHLPKGFTTSSGLSKQCNEIIFL